MNKLLFIIALIFFSLTIRSQDQPLNLTNVLVVGQQDKLQDQYTLELAVLELMQENNINAKASLNVIKQGQGPTVLASDSIQRKLVNEGIDTYMLISVRGYDKRFNPSSNVQSMEDELSAGHLFKLWRESASTITFTVIFYRNNIPARYDLIRVRAGNSEDKMMKRLKRKVEKLITKEWT